MTYKSACYEAKHRCKRSGGAKCQHGKVAVPRKRSQKEKALVEKVVESEDSLPEKDVQSKKRRSKYSIFVEHKIN